MNLRFEGDAAGVALFRFGGERFAVPAAVDSIAGSFSPTLPSLSS
jgi:hypothetical protein